MAGVSGDFIGFAKLREAVTRLASPEWRAQLAQGMGAAALKQLMDSFRNSRDPYGKPWAKLSTRRGKPLMDTGRMRASASLLPRPAGFAIVITAAYASYHQHGVKEIKPVRARLLSWKGRDGRRYFARRVSIPRRQMLPMTSTGGTGPIWGKAMHDEAVKRRNALFKFTHGKNKGQWR